MNKINKIEAVFIDRDGTIGGDDTIHYPGKFECFPFTHSCIEQIKENNIKIFAFTNQPGISRGMATEQDFIDELKGFGFDNVLICPHSPEDGCKCRKPGIGMLLKAASKHLLNLENCIVIGDRWSDMAAAKQANCLKILVKTGSGHATLLKHQKKIKRMTIEYIAEDLKDAVQWIFQSLINQEEDKIVGNLSGHSKES